MENFGKADAKAFNKYLKLKGVGKIAKIYNVLIGGK